MIETPVTFTSAGRQIRGILHRPDAGSSVSGTGIIFLSGWSGSRIGPHRMFVSAARSLNAQGCFCLRFDFAGRGESDGAPDEATIQSMTIDAKEAVSFLLASAPVSRIVLLGMCSGAKVAIAEATDDPRVSGLVLWSGEAMGYLRSSATNAARSVSVIQQYLKKLTRISTWKKILTFQVNARMANKAVFGVKGPDEEEIRHESAVLDRLKSVHIGVLFIYGGRDEPARLAAESYESFFESKKISCEFHQLDRANHNFYSMKSEAEVIGLTATWLSRQQR